MFRVSSMTAPLRRVALRQPGSSMINADALEWDYGSSFDARELVSEHASFVELLQNAQVEIYWMTEDDDGNADAVFTYDASLMTPQGAILMSLGKTLRSGEEELHRSFYLRQNIPIIGQISGDGRLEAGDTIWLDDKTVAVGRGYRTNAEGIRQLTSIMESIDVRVFSFDLPAYRGPSSCLHLMSLISIVDTKKALICRQLLPVGLLLTLSEMGFELIEAPFGEFESSDSLSTNVLAVAPGKCIAVAGFNETLMSLRESDIEVDVFDGGALCIGGVGGPTCLSRPLLRSS